MIFTLYELHQVQEFVQIFTRTLPLFWYKILYRTTAEFCCLFFSQKNSMNSSNSVKHDVEHHLNVCCTTIFYYTWKCKPILSSLTVLKLALVLELYFIKISMIKLALAAN